jgi:hypothetical protein
MEDVRIFSKGIKTYAYSRTVIEKEIERGRVGVDLSFNDTLSAAKTIACDI